MISPRDVFSTVNMGTVDRLNFARTQMNVGNSDQWGN